MVENDAKTRIGIDHGTPVQAILQNGGQMESGDGVWASIRNARGAALNSVNGIRSSYENDGTIKQATGLRVEAINSGRMDQYYGLYIDKVYGTQPNQKWAIVSRIEAPSRFAGDIQIGDHPGLQEEIDALKEQVAMLKAQVQALSATKQ